MKNILCVLIVVMLLSSCTENEQNQLIDLETSVESALIMKTDIIRYHQVPAVFMAENRADLSFQLSGTVDRVLVKIGELVDKDQALMSVYNPNIDPALDLNIAKLDSLKIQMNQVQRDVENLRELRKNNSASRNALEHKETDLKDLMAQKKLVQSQINLALANQSESIIKSPFNGIVVSSLKHKGEFIQAGQVVMTVFQQDLLEVEVNITHLLWGNLKLDDLINGEYNEKTYQFKVVELAQTAEAKSHLMKVILQLSLNSENSSSIKNAIGQQVILNFPQNFHDVYQLPLETVIDDGINKPYIFTVLNNKASKIYINPIYIENGQIIFNTHSEIQGSVIFKGQAKLSEGMKVKVLK